MFGQLQVFLRIKTVITALFRRIQTKKEELIIKNQLKIIKVWGHRKASTPYNSQELQLNNYQVHDSNAVVAYENHCQWFFTKILIIDKNYELFEAIKCASLLISFIYEFKKNRNQGIAIEEKSKRINWENSRNLKSKLFSTWIEFAISRAMSL